MTTGTHSARPHSVRHRLGRTARTTIVAFAPFFGASVASTRGFHATRSLAAILARQPATGQGGPAVRERRRVTIEPNVRAGRPATFCVAADYCTSGKQTSDRGAACRADVGPWLR